MRTSRVRVAVVVLAAGWSSAGCGRAAFGGAQPGYDQQACTENALRHHPDVTVLPQAREQFMAGCRDGEAASCSALGVMHEMGLGTLADPKMAASLYDRACRADNPRGCVNLGALLARGAGVPQDPDRAERLFADACQKEEMSGCAQLGRLMLDRATRRGEGAVYGSRLLERACAAKERSACVDLGDGLTRLRQHHEALVAYTKACLLGDEVACRRMDGPRVQTSQEAAAGWRR